MLILSRKLGEGFIIGDDIHITVEGCKPAHGGGNPTIRIGIDAPRDLVILRDELVPLECDGNSKKE